MSFNRISDRTAVDLREAIQRSQSACRVGDLGFRDRAIPQPIPPRWYNVGEDEIGRFGIFRVSGVRQLQGEVLLEGKQPAAGDLANSEYRINGEIACPPGGDSVYQENENGLYVAVGGNSNLSPANGDQLGAKAGHWGAYKDCPSFLTVLGCIGSPADENGYTSICRVHTVRAFANITLATNDLKQSTYVPFGSVSGVGWEIDSSDSSKLCCLSAGNWMLEFMLNIYTIINGNAGMGMFYLEKNGKMIWVVCDFGNWNQSYAGPVMISRGALAARGNYTFAEGDFLRMYTSIPPDYLTVMTNLRNTFFLTLMP